MVLVFLLYVGVLANCLALDAGRPLPMVRQQPGERSFEVDAAVNLVAVPYRKTVTFGESLGAWRSASRAHERPGVMTAALRADGTVTMVTGASDRGSPFPVGSDEAGLAVVGAVAGGAALA